jgi:hypothetical protein
MDHSPLKPEVPAAEYKLYVRKGVPRLYLRNTNDGVYLSPKGVGWFLDGPSYTRDWSEIASVNLIVGHVPKNGPIGTCTISFRDGSVITVLSASKWGHSDDERNVEYGRFLTDFPRVIPDTERSTITFSAGIGRRQHAAMTVILVIAGLLFFALPVGLAIHFRSLEALLLAFAGFAFVYPLYKSTEANFPDGYSPDQVPPQLFP